MPIQIDIKVDDSQVRGLLERMESITSKTAKFLSSSAAPYMRESFQKNFEAEGRPKWPALAPATAEFRRKGREQGWWDAGDTSPILHRTGDLMKMVVSTEEKIEENTGEIVMEMNPEDMLGKFIGSPHGGATSYLKHQLGEGKLKQRQMVLFQNEDIEWLSKRYQDFITETIQND